jgi:hypothetical protein
MSDVWYCTREDVKSALDNQSTARNDAVVDRAISSAARAIEGLTHRKFYPLTATRFFSDPIRSGNSWRLWLDDNELISVSSLSSGGITISSSDYFIEPSSSGPPYTSIELDLAASSSFGGGNTWQRDVSVSGVFGYANDEVTAGTLSEALDNSETQIDTSNSNLLGVGSIFRVDDERFIVTDKQWLDTTQNLQTPLTAANSNVTVAVSTGSAFNIGEVILLDSERMLIVDVAGNNLTVKRAWDGSVLATHTGSDIYAPRTFVVERGALGTTAATHSTSTAVNRHLVPGLVRQLAIAEAIYNMQLFKDLDSGEKTLESLRKQVYNLYGRKARMATV